MSAVAVQRRRGGDHPQASSERDVDEDEPRFESPGGRSGRRAAAKRPTGLKAATPMFLAMTVMFVFACIQWWALSSVSLGLSPDAGGRVRVEGTKVGPDLPVSISTRSGRRAQTRPRVNAVEDAQSGGDDELTVFIGIKIGAGPRGARFSAIRRTWLEDALAEDSRVRIRFFPRADQEVGGISNVSATELAVPGATGGEDGTTPMTLRSLLVPTKCEEGRIPCMTEALFKYYLQNHAANGTRPASYFCNFDDDQYVVVPNLLKVLDYYSKKPPWRGRSLYIGNAPWPVKPNKKWKGVPYFPRKIKFLTGGAGYCLSRDLVERGARHFSSLPKYPDDVAVGQVVQYELGVEDPVIDTRFRSHLIYHAAKELPLEELSKQVAFGYDTKVPDVKALENFPNISLLFSHEEDPLRFRSLRCFLQKDSSGNYPPDCVAPGKRRPL